MTPRDEPERRKPSDTAGTGSGQRWALILASVASLRIDDLLEEIPDTTLRAHLEREVTRLRKATRFGLMYERHWPETALVSSVAIVVGDLIWRRSEADTEQSWRASAVNGDQVDLTSPEGGTTDVAAPADLCVGPARRWQHSRRQPGIAGARRARTPRPCDRSSSTRGLASRHGAAGRGRTISAPS
jgi:hypothetical protein